MLASPLFICPRVRRRLCSKCAFIQARMTFHRNFTLLKIEGPDLKVPVVTLDDLPQDWRSRLEVTRDLGAAWLQKKEAVLLQIPSAIVPQPANFFFNPVHPAATKFRITETFSYPFDARLKK